MIDISALFARLGRFFGIAEDSNYGLRITVPDDVDAALSSLGSSLGAQYEAVRNSILDGLNSLQQSGASANGTLTQRPCQRLILLTVSDDKPAASSIDLAIAELISQFIDAGETLDASAISGSIAYDSGNTGNGKGVISTKRADGKSCLFAFAEDVHLECLGESNGIVQFSALGEPSIDPLMPTWPGGSGTDTQIVSRTASSSDNLVANGTFEDSDDNSSHLPEGWLAPVATLGTTLKMSSTEIQTVIISGSPDGGFYTLSWVNADGKTFTTAPLAFNATDSDVQTALQALPGLAAVEVSATGTTPNYTHTITFVNVTNPAELTSTNALTGGTSPAIAHNTSTAGSANVFRGARSVEFASNGSQLTTIQVPVTLDALTQYACCVWVKASSAAPAAGVLTVDFVDGVGGTVVNDQQGTANSVTLGHADFTTSFQAVLAAFRTPADMPAQVYLRIRISTAVTNGVSLYLDDVYLGPMDELYTDGPSVTVFDGSTAWLADDEITLTITNDRAGLLHEWLDRVLSLRENRLQFPVTTGGEETQSDSLVSVPTDSSILRSEEGYTLTAEDGTVLASE